MALVLALHGSQLFYDDRDYRANQRDQYPPHDSQYVRMLAKDRLDRWLAIVDEKPFMNVLNGCPNPLQFIRVQRAWFW